jgi:predicted nucleotidyltransferase
MTVGEVAALTPRGSEVGVRKSLGRLVEQGIVRATEMGRNRVHELNRDHVAAPIAEALAGLRLVLWKRFRSALGAWDPKPVYGCVFGSAARGDGDADSDIDLLLVRAPVAGETDPRRASAGLAEMMAGRASEFMASQLTARQTAKWDRQVKHLHELVPAWTGNPPLTLRSPHSSLTNATGTSILTFRLVLLSWPGSLPPTASAAPGSTCGTVAMTTAVPRTFSAARHPTVPNSQSPCCGFWTLRMKPTTA